MSIRLKNKKQMEEMCYTVKKYRIKKGMSVEMLAQQTQIPQPVLFALDVGVVSDALTMDMFFSLCRLLELHLTPYFSPQKE